MTSDPLTWNGAKDESLLRRIAMHVDEQLSTAVALICLMEDSIGDDPELKAQVEVRFDLAVVNMVASALALITSSWEMVGYDVVPEDDPHKNQAWLSPLLEKAIAAARFRFNTLRFDYRVHVGYSDGSDAGDHNG